MSRAFTVGVYGESGGGVSVADRVAYDARQGKGQSLHNVGVTSPDNMAICDAYGKGMRS